MEFQWTLFLSGVLPIFASVLLLTIAGFVARDRNGIDVHLDESTAVVTQVRNLVPIGLVVLMFYAQLLYLYSPIGWRAVSVYFAGGCLAVLVFHLSQTIVLFCTGRPQASAINDKDLLERARFGKLRQTRRRFIWCLALYYLAGLLSVMTIFADIYSLRIQRSHDWRGDSFGADTKLLVLSRMPNAIQAPSRHGKYDLLNRTEVIQSLSAFISKGHDQDGIALDITIPGMLDSAEIRQTIVAMTVEASQMVRKDAKQADLVFHHDHSCDTQLLDGCPILFHVTSQNLRPAFVYYSTDYSDAFFMSAMTLITVGLSDNAPSSFDTKTCVVTEELIGTLFFFVFLTGLLSGLTE